MPKTGAEASRKAALVDAAIAAVGRSGTQDVTVAKIAREAGMSPALAHHYFGSKSQMLVAAMRHILAIYGQKVRAALASFPPGERAEAIVAASLDETHFDKDTTAAWLNFYALALSEPEAGRLLAIYHRRLRSNLVHALRPRAAEQAERVAETLGALIDGVYLRAVIDRQGPEPAQAHAMVRRWLDEALQGS
ncbi:MULTISPECIES: transcriptional regulator BetI [unclassified Paracoccus (in: a-proteobacteria)]|uniref:choline-binding transcriptional repressor BetI n=1 Tax=unclassified Paracoccus (in: a-proteobacteria) TaxID=2688777 RepID=UPI001600D903|nr:MULTISPECIES: transcriptional regulator BetI [unclassified Paracoccus (in: a-proteobacteria)]MBB1490060.1 transcriptional regulator BetI [Paracoccus sp. MC1854]MBB1496648.1 transcriptional regulator BetI [Paracoccus sp. MC1862]QQO43664.1 transcriptional regulator BetI [Paracoccus sp. MC1862]